MLQECSEQISKARAAAVEQMKESNEEAERKRKEILQVREQLQSQMKEVARLYRVNADLVAILKNTRQQMKIL